MNDRIEITQAAGTWVVRAGGAVIAESRNAVKLSEGDLKPVVYFPKADVAMAFLDASEHRTTCPLKGEARYYDIVSKSTVLQNAVWSYEAPKPEAAGIAGMLAFDADGVAVEQV
ncbi:DUF427 domain-containing protein [Marivita sp. GX14005]|uniref:DUF427 domain-containing protein n=1 Tax=Marivita sp. GX14005 TaxID=2942276 RepID=UPI0020194F94|nr:DUF427 domain-containing protein [Marivita sp. GX14005]MCL3882644.1 DUF427 domain-containing protein [Marivita sp. GX14005]